MFSSVQFSHSVMSDSLQSHEPQHARPPCPSTTPRVHSNPCPLSRWCHPTISSSVVPFSSCPQSLPASGSFQMSQFSASGGQSIGVSASTSVLPMNTQDWSPLEWTDWISLLSRDSQEFSPTPQFKSINSSVLRKLVEVMEFQLSYFKSWKTILWKCCTQYANKFGKLSSGQRTGKGQFSFQSQRNAMPKNAQTTAQWHSSHTLIK